MKEKLREFELEEIDTKQIIEFRGKNFKLDYSIDNLIDPNALASQYTLEQDPDMQRAKGNIDSWLDIKLRKAETKLIKLTLLTKLHTNEALTQLEQQYLARWKEELAKAELIDLDMVMVPAQRTNVALKTVLEKDGEFFEKLLRFDYQGCKELSLADVAFEISHFYDTYVIDKVGPKLLMWSNYY